MRAHFTLAVFASLPLAFACVNERTYVDEGSSVDMWSDGLGGTGIAALRGDVGELEGIDNTSNNMWTYREGQVISLSGDVPHQARPNSSVYLDIRIANADQMAIGEEIRQEGIVDVYSANAPALDVYICPNGEGISGNADDIVVTKVGRDSFTFEARSTDEAQNLDVDLDLEATE